MLERESTFGTGISSRNSEVIHAGLYYVPGSLKAGSVSRGANCCMRSARSGRSPTLAAASSSSPRAEQADTLRLIQTRDKANGVGDLRELDHATVAALEPALDVYAALLSPSTGIVDSHALMLALLGDAERDGAMFPFGSPVLGGYPDSDGIVLQVGGEAERRRRGCARTGSSTHPASTRWRSAVAFAVWPPKTCPARGSRAACISP